MEKSTADALKGYSAFSVSVAFVVDVSITCWRAVMLWWLWGKAIVPLGAPRLGAGQAVALVVLLYFVRGRGDGTDAEALAGGPWAALGRKLGHNAAQSVDLLVAVLAIAVLHGR